MALGKPHGENSQGLTKEHVSQVYDIKDQFGEELKNPRKFFDRKEDSIIGESNDKVVKEHQEDLMKDNSLNMTKISLDTTKSQPNEGWFGLRWQNPSDSFVVPKIDLEKMDSPLVDKVQTKSSERIKSKGGNETLPDIQLKDNPENRALIGKGVSETSNGKLVVAKEIANNFRQDKVNNLIGKRIEVEWSKEADEKYFERDLEKVRRTIPARTRWEAATVMSRKTEVSYVVRYDFLVKYKNEIDTTWDPDVIENLTGARKVRWQFKTNA